MLLKNYQTLCFKQHKLVKLLGLFYNHSAAKRLNSWRNSVNIFSSLRKRSWISACSDAILSSTALLFNSSSASRLWSLAWTSSFKLVLNMIYLRLNFFRRIICSNFLQPFFQNIQFYLVKFNRSLPVIVQVLYMPNIYLISYTRLKENGFELEWQATTR